MLQDVSNTFDLVIDSYLKRMERKRKEDAKGANDDVNRERLEHLRIVATEMKDNLIQRLVQDRDFLALDENAPGADDQRDILQAKATAAKALEEVEETDIKRCRELEAMIAQKRQEEKKLILEIQNQMKAANDSQMEVQDKELKKLIDEALHDQVALDVPTGRGGDERGRAEEIARLLEGINHNNKAVVEEVSRLEEQRRELAEVEEKLTDKAMGIDTHLHFDDDTLEGSRLCPGESSEEEEDTEANSTHLKAAIDRIQQAQTRWESFIP